MHIARWPLSRVKPYDGNPRLGDDAVAAVKESIRRFGFRQPIVVDSRGVIICGHVRYRAAGELKLTHVPVHVARDLTPKQVRAYRIADNKTAELSRWHPELLPIELRAIQGKGLDLTLLGFSAEELSALLDTGVQDGHCDPDAVPEPPDEPRTQPGDLWTLGPHRLLCGDSASEADVDRLIRGAKIHLVNMDPPYNVKVEPRSNNAIAAGLSSFGAPTHHQKFDAARQPGKKPTGKKLRAKDRPLKNDFVEPDEFDRLLMAWFGNAARVLAPGGGFYIWGGYANCANYPAALAQAELYFSQAIIWVKEHPVLTRKDFMGNHEWCFYGWREGGAHRFFGPHNVADTWQLSSAPRGNVSIGGGVRLTFEDGRQLDVLPPAADVKRREIKVTSDNVLLCSLAEETDVWRVKKVPPASMIHLTEKPVELAVRAIRLSTLRGENVLDLFGGSGSTLIGCHQTDRRAYLMELDPLYCDVIVQRFEAFTGQKAKLEKGAAQPRAQGARKTDGAAAAERPHSRGARQAPPEGRVRRGQRETRSSRSAGRCASRC